MLLCPNDYAGSMEIFFHIPLNLKKQPPHRECELGDASSDFTHRLVDGGVDNSQPEFSHWFIDVGWKVKINGTDPDLDGM